MHASTVVQLLPRRAVRSLGAFTLIELLVAAGVLGILGMIALPSFSQAALRARVAHSRTELKRLARAVEAYHTDNTEPPRMSWGSAPFADSYHERNAAPYKLYHTLGSWMTTPVAYLPHFNQVDPLAPNVTQTGERTPPWYGFHDAATGRDVVSATGTEDPRTTFYHSGALEQMFGPWALMGAGPSPETGSSLMIYDPTNGIASEGSLWVTPVQRARYL